MASDDKVLIPKLLGYFSATIQQRALDPLGEYTDLSVSQIQEVLSLKLALVGLAGFGESYPSEISGGMQKRAGHTRAMALDPENLFFDEPSAGLDPISSQLLDALILELRKSLRATVVIVRHELASIFAIGDNTVFLDPETQTKLAVGDPKTLRGTGDNPVIHRFLTRAAQETRVNRPAL